ncbi:MAG: nicotinate phosphoribosyltransferase [Saccharofermentanales bacterium]
MVFQTDSYNASHFGMYPPGMTEASGYAECRANSDFENLSFFGLQYIIKKRLMESDPSKFDIDYAEARWNKHGEPFNRKGWERIQDLGYWPVEIQAVPEGSWIPRDNVLLQIRSTDPSCAWLPTWLETSFDQIWYPIAVATRDKINKFMLRKYLEDTGCERIPEVLPFMLHDFGYRGCPCEEAAAIGGAAHLTNFLGSDTFPACDLIRDYYHEDMAGFSIPASNHAVITSWGKENEDAAFENVLDKYLKPGSIVACVSDSYDIFRAVDTWGTKFKDKIVNSGGRLVVRPDSGNAEDVSLACINKLMKYFGYTVTSTGYKLLPDCIRLIWGDGLNPKTIDQVLYFLMCNDIAAENIAFGMGSAMLQEVRRDMVSLAFKVNEKVDNGIRTPINKSPVTGKGKASKAGRQALVTCEGYTFSIPENQLGGRQNLLRTVYKDGELLIDEDFATIRERTNKDGFDDYYGII